MSQITSKDSILYSRLLLGRARHYLDKARQKELSPYQLSPRQASVLTVIEDLRDQATLCELAKRMDRNINTISIQLTRMEKDGFLKKVREKPKSNQLRFELTEKGLNSCKEVKKIASLKAIMGALTEKERQQLIELLEKIINEAQKYDPSA
jgi:DNA-binding MarR family transcriptional regulator